MEILSRASWGARQPRSVAKIKTPTHELWLHHSAGPTTQTMRQIQNFHMDSRGWTDFAYSFGVHQDGRVFMGRGPGVAGGHTAGRNSVSHAICAIGNFQNDQPTAALLESIAQLVANGIMAGWWTGGITGPHANAPGAKTSCCGNKLIREIPGINRRAADIVNETVKAGAALHAGLGPWIEVVTHLPSSGYWMVNHQGHVHSFGGAPFFGSLGGIALNAPIVGMVARPQADGYWLVSADGGVFAFGAAGFYGSMGGKPMNAPVRSIAPTTTGEGYWLIGEDGGLFAFGDAQFLGNPLAP